MNANFFDRFGVMIDQSRNAAMNVPSIKRMIDILEKLDYNFLMLYTEDTYEVNNQPYFGRQRGRYSKEELKELVAYGNAHHVELIPCIQTLAHLSTLMHWPMYAKLRDCNDILCAGEEEVYELIEDMFATLHECFTTRTLHIGMDEAGSIGLGTYLQKHGVENRMDILLKHLTRVAEIAAKYDFNLLMWGDMFYKLTGDGSTEVADFDATLKEKIPKNVTLVYWEYYYTEQSHYDECIKNYQKLQPVWFAGGTWAWTGFVPHLSYSAAASTAAMRSCMENGVRNYFTTIWGDAGAECSRFSTLPELYRLSCFAHGVEDADEIKRGFQEMFGIEYDDFYLAELPDTPNNDGILFNPDKYMFYNDCLTGLLDCTVNGTEAARYAACGEKLKKLCDNPEYGVMFESLYRLCRLLEVKYDIGVKTRTAYQNGDRKALSELLGLYDENIIRLQEFYDAFEKRWMWENKPHGFDVMDIRLGGLRQRFIHAKQRIERYLNGEIEKIEELEEPILDVSGDEAMLGKSRLYFSWASITSANVI
ncbi:MAG: beta-N-acetylhexosaminidase [Clostridia bacterium]|nr:beta-N-acetylhexosaminidase [Clostridia bacterium]